MKSLILLLSVMCVHVMHMALGVPAEGIEQLLIATFQSHPHS